MRAIGVSTGDPGGVGPEIALRATLESARACVLYGDASWLAERARALGAGDRLRGIVPGGESQLEATSVGLVDVARWSKEALQHEPTAAGGKAQCRALDAAIEAARAGRISALCTAPMSKAAVNLGGREFVGHTEHLARACSLPDDAVTMLFLGPRLRVALATTHVAVRELPAAITEARVRRSIVHLAEALLRIQPGPLRIAISGLNPHAGEGGLFGDEELRVVAPAIARLRGHAPYDTQRVELLGPLGAETALRFAAEGRVHGVVVMTHDQGTIASKLLDWTQAVNVTWGLPFVRTSVDHGVAYDAAKSGQVDASGMRAALELAERLAPA